jgi:hypothetical protein
VTRRHNVKTPAKRRIVGKARPVPPPAEKSHHLDKRAERLIAAEPGSDDELLTTIKVADWLGTSCQWLELGRSVNYGPPFVHVSERVIRYRRGDVKDWLRSRTRNCVAEYANGVSVVGTTPFRSLVSALPRGQTDDRDTIVVAMRVSDTLEAVVVAALEQGELLQFDSALAYRSVDGKRPTKVSLPWLQAHLRERFQFTERGKVVDPPWLAKFLLKQWGRFPDFQSLDISTSTGTIRKRRHGPRGPGPNSL